MKILLRCLWHQDLKIASSFWHLSVLWHCWCFTAQELNECSLQIVYSRLDWHSFYVLVSQGYMYCFRFLWVIFCLSCTSLLYPSWINEIFSVILGSNTVLVGLKALFPTRSRVGCHQLAWGWYSPGLAFVVELLMALISYLLPAIVC